MGWFNHGTELVKKGLIIDRNNKVSNDILLVLDDRIRNIVNTIFEYENLPEGTPSNAIENMLYDNGKVIAWSVAGKVYFSSQFVNSGERDAYGLPMSYKPIYMNGKNSTWRKADEVVIIRNNRLGTATNSIVAPFISKLALTQEAITDRLQTSLTKWMVNVPSIQKDDDENVRRLLRSLLNGSGRVATIPAGLGSVNIEKLDFYEEFEASEYWEDFNNTFNLLYQLLGIKGNANEDKKERLLVDEVNIYEERTTLILLAMVIERKEALNKINEKFDTDIRLVINLDRSENDNINTTDSQYNNNNDFSE